MRIGDYLVEKGLLKTSDVELALAAQPRDGHRLCSELIVRGVLDFDEGARALGELRGFPCALAKHLANYDAELAHMLPSELGRTANALPIGRTSAGALIVAARDPDPALRATLQRALGANVQVTLVIAPATRLELLLAAAYGAAPSDEFDVELDSAVDVETPLPPFPNVDMLDADSVRLALSDLDDVRVAKDPSQSGLMQLARTLTPAAPSLTATRFALERTPDRDTASDLAMGFIAGRWRAGAILAIREQTAIGYRGHGVADLAELRLPLGLASTVAAAVASKRVATVSPASPAQDQLVRVLHAQAIVAAPIVVGDEVIAVVATGDSIHGTTEATTVSEMDQLAQALGAAYDRIRRT